jgi:hypothetical protein
MAERSEGESRAVRGERHGSVRNVAAPGGAAAEIERAKTLLDSRTIDQAEFDALKAKALA